MSNTGPDCIAIFFLYSGESVFSSGLVPGPGEVGTTAFRAGEVGFGYGVVLVFRGNGGAPLLDACCSSSALMLSRKGFEGKLKTFSLKGAE